MRNLLFLIAVVFIITITSCQKNTNNSGGPYTCQCTYALVTGYYYRDTTTATTYANGTTMTDAQNYCSNAKSSLIAAHGVTMVNCGIIE